MVYLLVLIASSSATAFISPRIKHRRTLIAIICCAIIVSGAVLSWNTVWLPEFMVVRATALLQWSWFAPPALALILVGAKQSEEAKARRKALLLKLLAAVVFGTAAVLLADQLDWYNGVDRDLSGAARVDADGVVRQTSAYSCGAAACATLLRKLEIDPDATERQLAPLCLTRRLDGVTPFGIAVGLKSVAGSQGWHVREIRVEPGKLARIHRPVVAIMQDHAVVLCRIDENNEVEIADPMRGLYKCPLDLFTAKFLGEIVVLYRNDPFE